MEAPKETGRQSHILETALKVFARHGFKKTSMEDIAQAAQISRQGIYLHFKNKEDIFRASILKMMDDSLAAATSALNDKASPLLEDKLLQALDGWYGQYVGLFHIEASDLRQHARQMLNPEINAWMALFEKQMTAVIAEASSRKEKLQHATEITQILCACGMQWKHDLTSREEFLGRMQATLHICCQNL